MNIIDITEENREEYSGLLNEECLKSIGREYYRGIAGKDQLSGKLNAAMIWELKGKEDEERDTGSEILLYTASDEDYAEELLTVYNNMTGTEEVVRSFFELPILSDTEKASLDQGGFLLEDGESRDVIVTVSELAALPLAKKDPPSYINSLSGISAWQFKTGLMSSVFHGRYGLNEDLPFLPMSWFDPDISSCIIADDKINGMLLVHEMSSGLLRVELLFAMQPDADINLLNMMRYSIRAAGKSRSPGTRVILRRHSEQTKALIKKLFPDRKGEQVSKGSREASGAI
ncbi:MAG: hypothetical protein K5770_01335 [Lachnospiraceae bacterium]|nr:hypothetical protein [Lachnospiraceae bacterium]